VAGAGERLRTILVPSAIISPRFYKRPSLRSMHKPQSWRMYYVYQNPLK
jgi:hypothetical protein